MRVLLAHNNYSVTGGAEVFYHGVGSVLEDNGHDVAYFSAYEKECGSAWSGYFPASAEYKKGSTLRRVLSFGSMVYSKKAKLAFKKLIEDFQPDIIHVFAIYVKLTPSILDAARDMNVPVVMSCNDYKHICPNYKLYHHGNVCEDCKGGNFYKAISNRCCHNSLLVSAASALESYTHDWLDIYKRNVHTFLFSSEFMARKTEQFWGDSSFKWRKLRNPFESSIYPPSYNTNGAVLFFGRLIDEKGVDILINAAALLPEVPFRVIGDGPDIVSLKQLAASVGADNVLFLGSKWKDDLEEELKSCRFVVVPSIWHENFPYVINQAFAFGKPVIGSDRGGIPELVQHGTRGIVYNVNDHELLARAIKELWENPEKVKKLGVQAKEFSDREFNHDSFYRALLEIYKEVLS